MVTVLYIFLLFISIMEHFLISVLPMMPVMRNDLAVLF